MIEQKLKCKCKILINKVHVVAAAILKLTPKCELILSPNIELHIFINLSFDLSLSIYIQHLNIKKHNVHINVEVSM